MMESTAKTQMMLAMTGSPTLVKYAYELAQHKAELDRVRTSGRWPPSSIKMIEAFGPIASANAKP
jgi:hypothetical protein